jgi:nucleotide-binding universal stress UspA family protein
MPPILRILVPVDFSDRCLGLLPQAKAIASRYNAEITLLHVVNPVYTIPAAGPFGPVLVSIPPSVFTDAVKQLDLFGADQLGDVPVRRLVYEGDPVDQIVSFVHSEETQLVVIPTHGFGVLRRFLIGSVSAKVLHDVACPVLTGVHTEQRPDAKPVTFSKILCAVDLGPESGRTLAWASQFAKDFHAQLEIVHALGLSSSGCEREELQKLQDAVGAHADNVEFREGEAAKTVCSVAESIGADLLVIGRGSHEDRAGRLRTNAYAIIRQSPCPVVSV